MLKAMGHQAVEVPAPDGELGPLPRGALVVASTGAVRPLLQGAQEELTVIVVSDAFGDLSAREMLRLGVKGLLQVGTTTQELAACLQKVGSGGRYIPLELATAMAENAFSPELTTRELEVLQCLASGLPNRAVAEKVGIAEGTVKSHVKSILSKLGASGRTEAVQISVRRGLLAAPHPARSTACSSSQLGARESSVASGEADSPDGD